MKGKIIEITGRFYILSGLIENGKNNKLLTVCLNEWKIERKNMRNECNCVFTLLIKKCFNVEKWNQGHLGLLSKDAPIN